MASAHFRLASEAGGRRSSSCAGTIARVPGSFRRGSRARVPTPDFGTDFGPDPTAAPSTSTGRRSTGEGSSVSARVQPGETGTHASTEGGSRGSQSERSHLCRLRRRRGSGGRATQRSAPPSSQPSASPFADLDEWLAELEDAGSAPCEEIAPPAPWEEKEGNEALQSRLSRPRGSAVRSPASSTTAASARDSATAVAGEGTSGTAPGRKQVPLCALLHMPLEAMTSTACRAEAGNGPSESPQTGGCQRSLSARPVSAVESPSATSASLSAPVSVQEGFTKKHGTIVHRSPSAITISDVVGPVAKNDTGLHDPQSRVAGPSSQPCKLAKQRQQQRQQQRSAGAAAAAGAAAEAAAAAIPPEATPSMAVPQAAANPSEPAISPAAPPRPSKMLPCPTPVPVNTLQSGHRAPGQISSSHRVREQPAAGLSLQEGHWNAAEEEEAEEFAAVLLGASRVAQAQVRSARPSRSSKSEPTCGPDKGGEDYKARACSMSSRCVTDGTHIKRSAIKEQEERQQCSESGTLGKSAKDESDQVQADECMATEQVRTRKRASSERRVVHDTNGSSRVTKNHQEWHIFGDSCARSMLGGDQSCKLQAHQGMKPLRPQTRCGKSSGSVVTNGTHLKNNATKAQQEIQICHDSATLSSLPGHESYQVQASECVQVEQSNARCCRSSGRGVADGTCVKSPVTYNQQELQEWHESGARSIPDLTDGSMKDASGCIRGTGDALLQVEEDQCTQLRAVASAPSEPVDCGTLLPPRSCGEPQNRLNTRCQSTCLDPDDVVPFVAREAPQRRRSLSRKATVPCNDVRAHNASKQRVEAGKPNVPHKGRRKRHNKMSRGPSSVPSSGATTSPDANSSGQGVFLVPEPQVDQNARNSGASSCAAYSFEQTPDHTTAPEPANELCAGGSTTCNEVAQQRIQGNMQLVVSAKNLQIADDGPGTNSTDGPPALPKEEITIERQSVDPKSKPEVGVAILAVRNAVAKLNRKGKDRAETGSVTSSNIPKSVHNALHTSSREAASADGENQNASDIASSLKDPLTNNTETLLQTSTASTQSSPEQVSGSQETMSSGISHTPKAKDLDVASVDDPSSDTAHHCKHSSLAAAACTSSVRASLLEDNTEDKHSFDSSVHHQAPHTDGACAPSDAAEMHAVGQIIHHPVSVALPTSACNSSMIASGAQEDEPGHQLASADLTSTEISSSGTVAHTPPEDTQDKTSQNDSSGSLGTMLKEMAVAVARLDATLYVENCHLGQGAVGAEAKEAAATKSGRSVSESCVQTEPQSTLPRCSSGATGANISKDTQHHRSDYLEADMVMGAHSSLAATQDTYEKEFASFANGTFTVPRRKSRLSSAASTVSAGTTSKSTAVPSIAYSVTTESLASEGSGSESGSDDGAASQPSIGRSSSHRSQRSQRASVVSRASQLLDLFAAKQRRASSFMFQQALGRRASAPAARGLPKRRSQPRSGQGAEASTNSGDPIKPSECALCGSACSAGSCFCPPCTQRFEVLGPSRQPTTTQPPPAEKHWAQQSPQFDKEATVDDHMPGSENSSGGIHTEGYRSTVWEAAPAASAEVSNCVLCGNRFVCTAKSPSDVLCPECLGTAQRANPA